MLICSPFCDDDIHVKLCLCSYVLTEKAFKGPRAFNQRWVFARQITTNGRGGQVSILLVHKDDADTFFANKLNQTIAKAVRQKNPAMADVCT
jgi:hypothetical protein